MITIDLNIAKTVAHDIRRKKRLDEFEPLDQLIAKQIPNTNLQEIEIKRQIIRDKYVKIQEDIDSAKDSDKLLEVISLLDLKGVE